MNDTNKFLKQKIDSLWENVEMRLKHTHRCNPTQSLLWDYLYRQVFEFRNWLNQLFANNSDQTNCSSDDYTHPW